MCDSPRKICRTYRKWSSMIQRCTNPNHPAYPHYGAKGTGVCQRWRDSYEAFKADMGEAPEGMWLDRIDNSKGYEPGNCRWVTPKESAQNREQGGKKNLNPNSLKQKALRAGLAYPLVYQRVKLHGWDEATALSTPSLGRGKHLTKA